MLLYLQSLMETIICISLQFFTFLIIHISIINQCNGIPISQIKKATIKSNFLSDLLKTWELFCAWTCVWCGVIRQVWWCVHWPSLLLSWEDKESVEEDLSWYIFRENREEEELSQAFGCSAHLSPPVLPHSCSEGASGPLPAHCNLSVSKRGC